jgi:catechol-2,3-dioxygenase
VLGHVGLNVPDLDAARRYYNAVMPRVGTYLFFHPSVEQSSYSRNQTGLQHLAFMVRTRMEVHGVHSAVAELTTQFGGAGAA